MPSPDTLSASRRGFLMGIILAELMLITLFVLLLFLKNYQQEEQDLEEQFGGRKPLSEATKLGQLITESDTQRELSDIWTELTREVEKQAASPGQLDSWLKDLKDLDLLKDENKLEQELEKLREQLAESEADLEEEKKHSAELEQSASQQAKHLAEADNKIDNLKDEIAKTKAGGLVLCIHEDPGSRADKLHGKSIPLGTMYLEADGITLIERNEELRGMSVVDFVGDPFDTNEALDLLGDWPLNKKLSFEEFGERAKPFVRLGNQESEKRQNCRFSMNYYIEDLKTPHSVLKHQFQKYFFQQTDISRGEFERLRN